MEKTAHRNQEVASWIYDMKGHAEQCVARNCELGNKSVARLQKVATPTLEGAMRAVKESVVATNMFKL